MKTAERCKSMSVPAWELNEIAHVTGNRQDNCNGIDGHSGGAIRSPSIQHMLLKFFMHLHAIFMLFMRCLVTSTERAKYP